MGFNLISGYFKGPAYLNAVNLPAVNVQLGSVVFSQELLGGEDDVVVFTLNNGMVKTAEVDGSGGLLASKMLTNQKFYDDDRSTTFSTGDDALTEAYHTKADGLAAEIYMGRGNDTVSNGFYKGIVDGGDGNDKIDGKQGDDIIFGGKGNDILTGGSDEDVFVFDTALNASTNVDKITDFSVADDIMHLDNAAFKALSNGNLGSSQFAKNSTGVASDSSDRIIYETDTGNLFYDVDGNGSGAAVKFGVLGKDLVLTAQDFFIV
ncbi:MAG: calcium-binding protein [Pseudomonas sp.]|nr:MAG: calcium-binding protein [Pseudomonas sp.]